MNKSLHSLLLLNLVFICLSLTACKTLHKYDKAVSESETASVTESRLTFYRTIDSLSRQLHLSADSVSFIFYNPGEEFPTAFPSRIEGCTETPSNYNRLLDNQQAGNASRQNNVLSHTVKIYGLHLTENSEKKSVVNTDLKDSVSMATQSTKNKSVNKQSSKPSQAPKWIFFSLLTVLLLYILYKIRR